MEVASAQQPFEMNQQQDAMDIDLELDLGPLPEPEVIEPVSRLLRSTKPSLSDQSSAVSRNSHIYL